MDRKARLAWAYLAERALAEDALPRVLAGMGFDQRVATFMRGELAWWRPEYAGAAGPHSPMIAANNRRRRDAAVLMMLRHAAEDGAIDTAGWWRPAQPLVIYLDTYEGAWRDLVGARLGPSIIDLAAMMWACRYGQAGARIARLMGWQRVPEIREAA